VAVRFWRFHQEIETRREPGQCAGVKRSGDFEKLHLGTHGLSAVGKSLDD